MRDIILDYFNYFMIFYSTFIVLSYIMLIVLAIRGIKKHSILHSDEYTIKTLKDSPYAPGISIIAPAYNEEKTILDNVQSMLRLEYPNYEVIVINDGSKDKTLELLVDEYKLVKVPYAYVEKVRTKPFRALYKSTIEPRLIVVDKENGGTKADASNAGINVISNPYFICTDVDCILEKHALYRVIWPTMTEQVKVIAVSAAMRMNNGCVIEDGQMVEVRPPKRLIPLFQDLEYSRSYLIGKSGLSAMNAVQNVSGGFGLFDTDVAIKAGGYDGESFAEDMDLVARMIRHMCDSGTPYKIVQIPETCCWTEGPNNLVVLRRQRIRWGRGLLQMFSSHRDMVFNRKYSMYGKFTLPYILIFELLAPVIEFSGYCMIIYLFVTDAVNWNTIWIVFTTIFLFAQLMTILLISIENRVGGNFKKKSSYGWFLLASILEPFIYHPFLVFFNLRGYLNHIFRSRATWGNMTRKGYGRKKKYEKGTAEAEEDAVKIENETPKESNTKTLENDAK